MTGNEDFNDLFKMMLKKREDMNVVRYPQRPMIDGDRYYQTQKVF